MKKHMTLAVVLFLGLLGLDHLLSQSFIPTVPTAPPLVGFGVPVQIGVARQIGVNSSIGSTLLATAAAANSAYLVTGTLYCNQVVSTATVTVTISYTDISNTAQSATTTAAACTTLGSGSFATFSAPLAAKASTAINYSTTAVNTPKYDLRLQAYQISSN